MCYKSSYVREILFLLRISFEQTLFAIFSSVLINKNTQDMLVIKKNITTDSITNNFENATKKKLIMFLLMSMILRLSFVLAGKLIVRMD